MPEVRIEGRMYVSGHANDGVCAIMALLQDWFEAMEQDKARYRSPDPEYVRSGGKPPWTEAELETLVKEIDREIDQEVKRAPGTSTGSKAGPGFQRLAVGERLALAQQLDALIVQYETVLPVDHGAV